MVGHSMVGHSMVGLRKHKSSSSRDFTFIYAATYVEIILMG